MVTSGSGSAGGSSGGGTSSTKKPRLEPQVPGELYRQVRVSVCVCVRNGVCR